MRIVACYSRYSTNTLHVGRSEMNTINVRARHMINEIHDLVHKVYWNLRFLHFFFSVRSMEIEKHSTLYRHIGPKGPFINYVTPKGGGGGLNNCTVCDGGGRGGGGLGWRDVTF